MSLVIINQVFVCLVVPNLNSSAQRTLLKVKHFVFWNFTSRYMMQGYIKFAFATLSILALQFLFSQPLSITESVLSILFFVLVCLVFPTVLFIKLYLNYNKWREEAFKKQFGQVIQNLNPLNRSASQYVLIFCFRRLLQVVLIMALRDFYYFQIQLMVFMTLCSVQSIGNNKLFLNRGIEMFNEVFLLLICYHYFMFSQFVPDAQVKLQIGYSLIGITAFNFIVNILLNVIVALLAFKRKRAQKKMRKQNLKQAWYKMKVQLQQLEVMEQISKDMIDEIVKDAELDPKTRQVKLLHEQSIKRYN